MLIIKINFLVFTITMFIWMTIITTKSIVITPITFICYFRVFKFLLYQCIYIIIITLTSNYDFHDNNRTKNFKL